MKPTHTLTLLIALLIAPGLSAQDWTNWRGPEQNGISREKNLPSTWDFESGENVVWKSDIGGRATPIILNDRVYLNCRTTDNVNDPVEKIHSREQVVCWDLNTGKVLWKDVFNVFQTDIASPRVGWAAMCGDKETGNVFVHSVSGIFRCYSPEGKIVWEHSLLEEYGKISGYGGRTQTPIIDEDRIIVSYLAANWGDTKGPAPLHYYYAFNKKTGELEWVSAPGGKPADTNYSVPFVTVINGQRLLIGGNSDGGVHAMNARTGAHVWSFRMSKRGLNSSAVSDGKYVFISHGEDNIDNTEFGRVQCIDGSLKGDITESGSVWRFDGIKAGYTGLLVKDGVLYVVADTGNMYAFDSLTGKRLWEHNLGTVGKGSPVWADGKIYVMEVNGFIHILEANREGCKSLSTVQLKAADGNGIDEIYASPAISKGKVVFVTRDRTICIADKSKEPNPGQPNPLPAEVNGGDTLHSIQVHPYDFVLMPGKPVELKAVGFNKMGQRIGDVTDKVKFKLADSLAGITLDGNKVSAAELEKGVAGKITASFGDVKGETRMRMFSTSASWNWDFEGMKGVQVPSTWLRAHIKVKPTQLDGNTVLTAAGIGRGKGRPSHTIFMGRPDMKNYTVQADVRMTEQRRQLPNIGIVANRYNLILRGNLSKLTIQSWPAHLRMSKEINFVSDPDVWYTMKMKVETTEEEAKVFGKVWKKGEAEPAEWTLTATDPHPNHTGSPGLYYYAITDCMFDNVSVTFDK